MGLITKGMGAIMKKLSTASRNKSSKKLFKEASGGMQHPVIKPTLTKGESTKVWGHKLKGKFKKELGEATTGIDKALKDTGQLLQKIKKIPITKSGVSKGKDLKTKTKTKHYYPPKDF